VQYSCILLCSCALICDAKCQAFHTVLVDIQAMTKGGSCKAMLNCNPIYVEFHWFRFHGTSL